MDSLNEEVARFKAVSKVSSEQDGHVKDALEKQIEEHRELHQKQVRTRGIFLHVPYLLSCCYSNLSETVIALTEPYNQYQLLTSVLICYHFFVRTLKLKTESQ